MFPWDSHWKRGEQRHKATRQLPLSAIILLGPVLVNEFVWKRLRRLPQSVSLSSIDTSFGWYSEQTCDCNLIIF